MAKFLATAAEIVGGVALIATGVGAVAGVGLGSIGTLAGSVAKVAGLAAAALEVGATLLTHRLTAASPDTWNADPDAGMDIVLGDAFNAGNIIYRFAYGDKNKYETIVTHWSIGPVQSIDQLYVDQIAYSVDGTTVDITDRGQMHEMRQLGQCPELGILEVPPINPWAWTAQHKLSGKAATMCTFEYDSSGSVTFESIPACGWRGKGVLCYDPRKDDTYPGGAGPQRAADETTWAWSVNPFVVGLTWCLGWRQGGARDKLVAGVGLPLAGLLVDTFVEAANVADANGWTCGGVKSTTDDKWDVLKDILQAGGGEPMRLGALLGVVVKTPRVSLATITRDDLAQGDISIQATPARRDRINAVSPRYQAELKTTVSSEVNNNLVLQTSTTWTTYTGAPIVVDDYVTADGRQRRKEVDYPLVQCFAGDQPTQVAQLARYEIEDAREFGPISLPCKIRMMGFKPGDCLTVDLPEAGLVGQDVLLMSRGLEPSTGVVTITARSETAAKHAFALGQTTTPPATASLPANAWSLNIGLPRAAHVILPGTQIPDYPVTSTSGEIDVAAFIAGIDDGRTINFPAGSITGLQASTSYVVLWQLSTSAYVAAPYPASTQMASADFVFIVTQSTLAADGTAPDQPTPPPGYVGTGGGGGDACPVPSARVLLADAAGTGPGATVAAGDLVAGEHFVWSPHEVTGEWGAWPVTAVRRARDAIWAVPGRPDTSPSHLWRDGERWVRTDAIGAETGERGDVVAITIGEAHTYVLVGDGGEWLVSHNKTAQPT